MNIYWIFGRKHSCIKLFIVDIKVALLTICSGCIVLLKTSSKHSLAIGGSLSRSDRVTQDMDEDDEALECSSGSIVIVVPPLNEIVVPAQLIPPPAAASSLPTSLSPSRPPSLPLSPQPQTQAFRRVNAEKRKSDLSYSVGGADLRRKRRRLESFPAEISRDEYWEFLGIAKNLLGTLKPQ